MKVSLVRLSSRGELSQSVWLFGTRCQARLSLRLRPELEGESNAAAEVLNRAQRNRWM